MAEPMTANGYAPDGAGKILDGAAQEEQAPGTEKPRKSLGSLADLRASLLGFSVPRACSS